MKANYLYHVDARNMKILMQAAQGPESWIFPVFPVSLHNVQYNYYLLLIRKITRNAHSGEYKIEAYLDQQRVKHRVYWKKGNLYDVSLFPNNSRVITESSFIWNDEQSDLRQISYILNMDGEIQICENRSDMQKVTVFKRENASQIKFFSKRIFDFILKKQIHVPLIPV
jgi:hypothetical protein